MNLLVAKYVSLASVPSMFFLSNMFRVAGWSLVSTVSRSMQPYVLLWKAQNKEAHIQYAAQVSTNITCSLAGLIVVAGVPLAEPFINWWLDRPCFPGMSALIFIAGAFLIDALFIASVNLLVVLNLHRRLALFLVIKSILTLALGGAFASVFEDPTVGVTAGIFAATLVSNIGMPFLCRNALSLNKKSYLNQLLVRPIGFFVFTILVAAYTAEIPRLDVRLAASLVAMAATVLLAWFAVLSAKDRQSCILLYNRFRHSRIGTKTP